MRKNVIKKLCKDLVNILNSNKSQSAAGSGGAPNMQSQIPQVTGVRSGSMNPEAEVGVANANFPPSRATPAGGQ